MNRARLTFQQRLNQIHAQVAREIERLGDPADMEYAEVCIILSPGEPALVHETLCSLPELLTMLKLPTAEDVAPLFDPRVGPPAPVDA